MWRSYEDLAVTQFTGLRSQGHYGRELPALPKELTFETLIGRLRAINGCGIREADSRDGRDPWVPGIT